MVRQILAAVVGSFLLAGVAHAERVGFDGEWKFWRGDVTGGEQAGLADGGWEGVQLPHDWSIAGPIDRGNVKDGMTGQGGFFPAGVGWYRKHFVVPTEWTGKRVSLDFDGVYMLGEVWVNGVKVGGHAYGYTPFSVDVTGKLKSGEENVVAVRVDNSKQVNSRWYSGSGIYRHVWMEVVEPVHLAREGVVVRTGKWAGDSASVTVMLWAENESGGAGAAVELETKVYEAGPDGKAAGAPVMGTGLMRVEFPVRDGVPLKEVGVEPRLILERAKWWSPETPDLYVAVTTVSAGGRVVDTRETVFGVRTVEVSAEKGFLLNGKREVLFGGCVHHDNGVLGAAAFDRAEERKVELLKSAGFNAVRTSHNMPSEAFLNACDRLGVMVVEEAFDCWEVGKNGEDYHRYFKEAGENQESGSKNQEGVRGRVGWKGDLDAMVMRDRNHPSVVMWSVGNEIPDFGSAQGLKDGTALIEEVKRLDVTRPVTAAVNWWPGIGGKAHDWKWEDADGLMRKLDLVGYNYQIGRYAGDHARVPGRVMVSTESYPRDMFACWAASEGKPYVVGDFVWTAMDYLGESGLGRVYAAGEKEIFQGRDEQFPVHGANCGDIDMTGWRKPVSHARNITWGRGERLYASVVEPRGDAKTWKASDWGTVPSWESWTWPGMEGKEMTVKVYSRCEKVRLYVNEKLVGEKPTGVAEQFHAEFEVPYEAGVLRTMGIVEGREVEKGELRTVGVVAGIRLVADREVIRAGGEDLSFVTVEAVDGEGRFQPNGDAEVSFEVSGPGEIEGVGNGDMADVEGYGGRQARLFHGRAVVVVRSGRERGRLEVRGRAEGLKEGMTGIHVQ